MATLSSWSYLLASPNAPSTFMTLKNQVLRPFLDKFVVVYLDDILIYSKSPEEHAQHVEAVHSALEQHHLYAKASKCQFGMAELDFLGHTISGAGIKVDARKVKAILEWPEPSDAHQLRCVLGLAGFYRRFVDNFSHIVAPLTNITGAKATWRWSEVEAKAFAELKHALTTTPVLATPDFAYPFELYTDASQFCHRRNAASGPRRWTAAHRLRVSQAQLRRAQLPHT